MRFKLRQKRKSLSLRQQTDKNAGSLSNLLCLMSWLVNIPALISRLHKRDLLWASHKQCHHKQHCRTHQLSGEVAISPSPALRIFKATNTHTHLDESLKLGKQTNKQKSPWIFSNILILSYKSPNQLHSLFRSNSVTFVQIPYLS